MQTILKWAINLLSAGPLKGYRTVIISVLVALLTVGKTLGWLDRFIDNNTYQTIMGMLTSAALVTASVHKP